MLARSTLVLTVIGLLIGLGWLSLTGSHRAERILEINTANRDVIDHKSGSDLVIPEEGREVAMVREAVGSPPLTEFPLLESATLRVSQPEASEEVPPESPLLPWRLNVLNVLNDEPISSAITLSDPSEELAPLTAYMPTVLPVEWRARTILIGAEGFRKVVISHDDSAVEKTCRLCPIRQLQLQILPPRKGEGAFDLTIRSKVWVPETMA